MIKKSLLVFLGMSLFIPNLYAANPFDDSTITIKKSNSNNSLETSDIKVVEEKDVKKDTKEENKSEKDNTQFPVKGKLCHDGIRLREWAWGPIIKKFDSTELTVLGISGDFYEVEIDGVKGFMHKNFISIPDCPASGKQPYYPGDTWEGGYLSREEGIKYTESNNNNSSDGKKPETPRKLDSEESKDTNSAITDTKSDSTKDTVVSTKGGLKPDDFKKLMKSMKTPSRDDIIKLAASKGISEDYVKILIGTTQREGYFKDTYLHYGWASAMLNQKVTIKKMQGWDPKHKGDSNYYSQKNINKGYKEAGSDVLKAVYLAIKYRNKKIIECNGMYKKTPKSYNMIYKSSKYNCSIYEKK